MIWGHRLLDLKVLEPGIAALAERYPEHFSATDVWDRLGTGQYVPIVVKEDGEPVGLMVAERQENPAALFIVYLRGEGLLKPAGLEAAQKLATSWGCVDDEGRPVVRFTTPRRGWERVVGRTGFRPTSKNYQGAR